MSHENIIRAWTDEEYRRGLSEVERALLPAHPAGLVELDDADLDMVAGGMPHDGHTHCVYCAAMSRWC